MGVHVIDALTPEETRPAATGSRRVDLPEGTTQEHTAPAPCVMQPKDSQLCPWSHVAGCRRTTQEGNNMVGVILLAVIGLGIGWFVQMRRCRARAYLAPATPGGIPRETLALDAFARGNVYLAEGQFADAIAAFQRARELDPKRAHVADRLAEVERRQHAASATLPTNGPS